MNDLSSSDTSGERNESEPRYSSMPQPELQALAVSAIREHRRLLAADAAVYDEWTRACAEPSVCVAVLKNLQDEYIARQKRSEAQQEVLSEIIDALGYVPAVTRDVDD